MLFGVPCVGVPCVGCPFVGFPFVGFPFVFFVFLLVFLLLVKGNHGTSAAQQVGGGREGGGLSPSVPASKPKDSTMSTTAASSV